VVGALLLLSGCSVRASSRARLCETDPQQALWDNSAIVAKQVRALTPLCPCLPCPAPKTHPPTYRSLKALAARACVWDGAYTRLFGLPPPTEYSVTTVKRLCRRSELKASRCATLSVLCFLVICDGLSLWDVLVEGGSDWFFQTLCFQSDKSLSDLSDCEVSWSVVEGRAGAGRPLGAPP
jgi:hypothetical protein